MKIRNGFVSNSSSSSFIVTNDVFNTGPILEISHMPPNLKRPEVLMVPYIYGGTYEFGRERCNYDDIGSRINWAYIQSRSIYETHKNGSNLDKSFMKTKKKFIEKHKDDVFLLEQVLIENIPGVSSVEWYIVSETEFDRLKKNFRGSPQEENDFLNQFKECYIDHGSMWYEKEREYEVIFEDKSSIVSWVFGKGNYIANRSDEYEDTNELEVNHMMDYKYDLDSMYYNPWNDPECFDDLGNIIVDKVKIAKNEEHAKELIESADYVNYFSLNKISNDFVNYLNEKNWKVFCDHAHNTNNFIIKLKKE
jgi:hypothetical protein